MSSHNDAPSLRESPRLSLPQIAALKSLQVGAFTVAWRPKLSRRGYKQLRDWGLLEEHWTWASLSRPDTGLSEAGARALAAALKGNRKDGASLQDSTEDQP